MARARARARWLLPPLAALLAGAGTLWLARELWGPCAPTGTLAGFPYQTVRPSDVLRGPIVVFHGRGGTEAQSQERLGELRPATVQVFPHGPRAASGGAAWTEARSTDPAFESELGALMPSVAALIRDVNRCFGKPYVIGHSQGGNVALALASQYPELVRGAIVSAAVIPESYWTTPFAVPVTVIHGTADAVVPYDRSAAMATQKGADLWPVDGAGHDYEGELQRYFEHAVSSVAGATSSVRVAERSLGATAFGPL